MRFKVLFSLLLLSPFMLWAQAKIKFNDFFRDQTLRIDYFHSGDAGTESFTLDKMTVYGIWAGNPQHLLDEFNNGKYYVKIYDVPTNRLIFSKGFNSYFGEYQTTRPALNGIPRTYSETVLLPLPKSIFLFVLEVRDKQNILHPRFIRKINPRDYHIADEAPAKGVRVLPVLKNGPAHSKVDVAFLAEGYRQQDFDLFKKDLKQRAELLFSVEPYRSNKKRFNIYGVFTSSQDSGADEPRKRIYRNTTLSTSFNALDLPRYLLTENNRRLRDVAAGVPYDALFIMVNSRRYGGGGIYNQYAVFTAHSPSAKLVFVHEFGHAFAGLADEYYTSAVAYDDFYPKGVEPTEPNITALLDSSKLKWPNEVNPGKAIPTNWNKSQYDRLSIKLQQIRRRQEKLRLNGGNPDSLKILKDKMAALDKKLKKFISRHPLKDKVGFFEGAGYASKGLYRSMLNCMMFSNREKRFCKVCQKAIKRMIDFYSAQ